AVRGPLRRLIVPGVDGRVGEDARLAAGRVHHLEAAVARVVADLFHVHEGDAAAVRRPRRPPVHVAGLAVRELARRPADGVDDEELEAVLHGTRVEDLATRLP